MNVQRKIQTFFLSASLAIASGAVLAKSALSEMYPIMSSMPIVITSPRSGMPVMTRTMKSPDGRYEFISEVNEPTMYMYSPLSSPYRPAKVRDTKTGTEMMVYLPIVMRRQG